jgi:glycosyltransferase involved in cell wall biosynthesis
MIDAALGHGAAREAAAGRVVVVIPTLDEEQSIADVVSTIPRAIVSRVIVADGGSRHATAARAKAAGADVIDAGHGYGRACLAATMAAEDADIGGKSLHYQGAHPVASARCSERYDPNDLHRARIGCGRAPYRQRHWDQYLRGCTAQRSSEPQLATPRTPILAQRQNRRPEASSSLLFTRR